MSHTLRRTCADSVLATTCDDAVDLILVDNGSSDPETLTLLERLSQLPQVHVVHDPLPFNWARLNNAAARRPRVTCCFSLTTTSRRDTWVGRHHSPPMRCALTSVRSAPAWCIRTTASSTVVSSLGSPALRATRWLDLYRTRPGYLHMATATRECSAVTGACLATRREVFEELGGFDEDLGVDLNDVDFCLRAGARGYRTLDEPAAELVHHESPSRGTAGGTDDIVNFVNRWTGYITEGDRYFNQHLTRAHSSCGLAREDEKDIWSRWYSTLSQA